MTDACPVCDHTGGQPVEAVGEFEIVRCNECQLEYTRNPGVSHERYTAAYTASAGIMDDVRPFVASSIRVSLKRSAFFSPPSPLTSAERWVLQRLKRRVPRGSTVLDVGCGSGRFLEALQRHGYVGVGLEPAASVAEAVRALGFQVVVGHAEEFDWSGDPAAVVLFEVLEHVPDPLPILRALRKRFPDASIGLSVPSPRRPGVTEGKRGASDYPPNHYLRWSTRSLEIALSRAGYDEVVIAAPRPHGTEFAPSAAALLPRRFLKGLVSGVQPSLTRSSGLEGRESPPLARRAAATSALVGLTVFHAVGAIAGTPQAALAARRGQSGLSLAAWAEPLHGTGAS